MTDEAASIPVAGSLSARIIRKCQTHKTCSLECKFRQVEDLGEIASFDTREAQPASAQPSFTDRLKDLFRR